MVFFFQEILRTAELYSPFTTTEEDVMNNELVGGLMSNVSVIYCYNQIFESEECSSQYIFKFKQLERRSLKKITVSNPVGALIFFRLLLSNYLNWKIYCDDHSSLSSTTAVHI